MENYFLAGVLLMGNINVQAWWVKDYMLRDYVIRIQKKTNYNPLELQEKNI